MTIANRLWMAAGRWWQFTAAAMIVFALAVLALAVGPAIEERHWPVLTAIRVLQIEPVGDDTYAIRYAYRKHRDCDVVSAYWFGIDSDGAYRFAVGEFADGRPLSTRPVGANVSRLMRVKADPAAVKLVQLVTYRCGLPWLTRAVIGPIDLALGAPAGLLPPAPRVPLAWEQVKRLVAGR